MDKRPIGVFDSGLGGASVLREALKVLPSENYIYYGDNKNAPYGDKSEKQIAELSLKSADFLIEKGIKAMLLACNTATGLCIRQIREKISIPVVSIEPAIKPACAIPGEGKVLMLATKATTNMERYKKLCKKMPDPLRVISIPCSGLVERIEADCFSYDDYSEILNSLLSPYFDLKVDSIVLGCTHYIFIEDIIYSFAKKHFIGECKMINGSIGTACQLKRVLETKGLLNEQGTAKVDFYTSAEKDKTEKLFRKLLYR